MRALILIALLAGCGDGGPRFTWGDSFKRVSDSFCAAKKRCFPAEVNEERCLAASYKQCEYAGNCELGISEAGIEAEQVCTSILDAITDGGSDACFYLVYLGTLPDECYEWFEFEPHPTL